MLLLRDQVKHNIAAGMAQERQTSIMLVCSTGMRSLAKTISPYPASHTSHCLPQVLRTVQYSTVQGLRGNGVTSLHNNTSMHPCSGRKRRSNASRCFRHDCDVGQARWLPLEP